MRRLGRPAAAFAVVMLLRGCGVKRKAGSRRILVGGTGWNGGTGLVWVTLATWRITRCGTGPSALLAADLLSGLITALAPGVRRNHSRITEGATR